MNSTLRKTRRRRKEGEEKERREPTKANVPLCSKYSINIFNQLPSLLNTLSTNIHKDSSWYM